MGSTIFDIGRSVKIDVPALFFVFNADDIVVLLPVIYEALNPFLVFFLRYALASGHEPHNMVSRVRELGARMILVGRVRISAPRPGKGRDGVPGV